MTALLLMAGALLGAGILLAGVRLGSFLSRSHLVSGRALVKQATAVSVMANEAASRAARDHDLAGKIESLGTTVLSRLQSMEEWLWRAMGEKPRPSPRRAMEPEPALPKSPMPRIAVDGWGTPPAEQSAASAEPVLPM